jgi:hypothetical protein
MPLQNILHVLFSKTVSIEILGVQVEQIQLMLVKEDWHSHAFGFLIWD